MYALRISSGYVFILTMGIFCITSGVSSQSDRNGVIRFSAQGNQSTDNATQEFCFSYPSQFFTLPIEPPEKFYNFSDESDVEICTATASKEVSNNTILLFQKEGNCSIEVYANYAKKSRAAGFILNLYPKGPINSSFGLEIIGAVGNQTFIQLKGYLEVRNDVLAQIFTYEESFFGIGILFLWLTACFCVAIGSYTGPYQNQDLQSTSSRQQILETAPGSSTADQKTVQIQFTVTLVMVLVIFITITLLLLYFFYEYLVYFFMGVFCFASGRATYEILNQIAHVFKFDGCMPRIKGCGIHKIFLAIVCITIPILWFVFRHRESIWILQDFLGVCFCIHLIQTLRIPNLQMCTVLLSLLFVYDIFFVFVTPYITSNGKSVMVEVATGGGSGETLPLLIKFPRASSGPPACNLQQSYSLLGFGDIIVPGFLVCFAHSFDIMRGDKLRPYFIVTMIGYGIGLSIAFLALFMSQTGQPALLYIVPCTLIAISATGVFRKQFKDLWKGSITITEVEP